MVNIMKKSLQITLGVFAFITLIMLAASFLFSRLGVDLDFLCWLGNLFLLIIAITVAKEYAQKLNVFWQVVFYVVAIFAIVEYLWTFFK